MISKCVNSISLHITSTYSTNSNLRIKSIFHQAMLTHAFADAYKVHPHLIMFACMQALTQISRKTEKSL